MYIYDFNQLIKYAFQKNYKESANIFRSHVLSQYSFALLPISVPTAEHMHIAAEIPDISLFCPRYILLSPQRLFEAFDIQLQRNVFAYQLFDALRGISVRMGDNYLYIVAVIETVDCLPYRIRPSIERKLKQQVVCPLTAPAINSDALIQSVAAQHFRAENYLRRTLRQICFQGFVGSMPPRKK